MDTSFYHISEKAVERVANQAALTVPGVRALDAKLAGLAGRSFPRIDVHLDRGMATAAIEAEIATSYPSPVAAITDAVRATIINHVRTLCGLDVARVKVTVSNVEADPNGARITWDDVARHSALAEPVAIRVTPSEVTHPVTKKRKPLDAIDVRSLVEDLRDVTVPAPPHVEHVDTPDAPDVQTSGFVGRPAPVAHIEAPAPRPVRVPMAPPAHETDGIYVTPSEVYAVSAPAPRPLTPVRVPAPAAVIQPVVHPTRVTHVEPPARRPLREVLVERPPLVPVRVPAPAPLLHVAPPRPQQVVRPQAPIPAPLKQITIRPVEKYYDRTR